MRRPHSWNPNIALILATVFVLSGWPWLPWDFFGGVVRLFLMYELKAHLIISKYTKEQQRTPARNGSLKNRTKNPEFFPQWTDYGLGRSDKISDPLLNYMGETKQNNNKKNWSTFLRLQRGKIRIKNQFDFVSLKHDARSIMGATIFHLVLFLDHLLALHLRSLT